MNRIVVTRTDRLGDVMLALPCLQYLRRALPEARLEFSCQPAFFEVLRPFLDESGIKAVASDDISWEGVSAALLLHAKPSLCFGAWRAGVSLRVGPRSKPWTFLMLNRGVRQRRSRAEKNEGQYNYDLAEHLVTCLLGKKIAYEPEPICLGSDPKSVDEANRVLRALGLNEPFVVLHPGMGGSALNLSSMQYAELVEEWKKRGPIVLSRGPAQADLEITDSLLKQFPDLKLLEGVGLEVLREVFRMANLVIAPSTGPLHLAHYVGTKTLGIYSREQSERKERWAPWGGAGESRVVEGFS